MNEQAANSPTEEPDEPARERRASRPAPPPPEGGGAAEDRRVGRHTVPWVRTRLRSAPGTAFALALLVLLTAALAAAFPLAMDSSRDKALRQAVAETTPHRTTIQFNAPQPGLEHSPEEREAALGADKIRAEYEGVIDALRAPIAADRDQSSFGVRTSEPPESWEKWLPRPRGLHPRFVLSTQQDLASHARVREGRMPRTDGTVTSRSPEVEAVVTEETAARLHIKTGALIRIPGELRGPLGIRITGIVTPENPRGAYWSTHDVLRTPSLVRVPSRVPDPPTYWLAGLLLPPDAAPALLDIPGQPERYWNIAPDTGSLDGGELSALQAAVTATVDGGGLLEVRRATDVNTAARTELDDVLIAHQKLSAGITPLITVAATGTATVALVVLLMSGGLAAGRRHAEFTVLRARGASLRALGGRLFAETAVVAVPAGALGFLAALLLVGEGRPWLAAGAAGAVTLVACVALPVRAMATHRPVRVSQDREDLTSARPSRHRTVAELTALAVAVSAVVALRRRGTSGGEGLVALAPVLVGVIAALLLVRLHPLPLRALARPVGRLRGLTGKLALARAARGSASAVLPLLALLTALTTAAFGGSVLAGVADTRERAALLATGADARVDARYLLDAGAAKRVASVDGVDGVTEAAVDYTAMAEGLGGDPTTDTGTASGSGSASGSASGTSSSGTADGADGAGATGPDLRVPLAVVDAKAYARLSERVGVGAFPPSVLTDGGGDGSGGSGNAEGSGDGDGNGDGRVVPALAAPATAARLGDKPVTLLVDGERVKVRVAAVRASTPAVQAAGFLVVDARALGGPLRPTTLLLTGDRLDREPLAKAAGDETVVHLRTEERARYADSPLQSGAERIYLAAVAAGAGYAALALLLSLARAAPERAALLARLRTMGLTRRDGRRLLVLESLPQALLASAGGAVAGWAAIRLLAPGTDLTAVALAAAAGGTTAPIAGLRADPVSLLVPSLAVVVLTVGVAALQAWWTGRRDSVQELRIGDR
ncbi:FtsX-like permease family protein [Streptomyces uncialis]|uniref:FtsX-like permease family protein n=1 Tax=Streptomyces uncialis TaxID=1048205 RepID=UPI00224E90CF|nr:FtsX-like permease family protein [Streptomyces uncialis]MCX4663922.1 ABC transporter permease [Streptomyces uncialis]